MSPSALTKNYNDGSVRRALPHHHTRVLCSDKHRLATDLKFATDLNPKNFFHAVVDSIRASAEIHKNGMVHGDINLLNIHWYSETENEEGHGVLVDFDMRGGVAWDYLQRTKEREREEAKAKEKERKEMERNDDEIKKQKENDETVD